MKIKVIEPKRWVHWAVRFSDHEDFSTYHREVRCGNGRVGRRIAAIVSHAFWLGNYWAIVKYKY